MRSLLAVLVLVLAAAPRPVAQPAPRPNVVVLVADDLGYGDLGAYGSADAKTPHLDALAARGLRFTDFYAGGPVCTPSRYALLTGLHAFRAGDPEMLEPIMWDNTTSGLIDTTETLAEALEEGGYETALIGKWHLGHGEVPDEGGGDTQFHPLHHGFGYFFGNLTGAIDYNTHWNRGRFLDLWERRRPVTEDSLRYATHVFGNRAVAFLDAHAGAGTTAPPFFLYLPFTAPHTGNTSATDPVSRTQLPLRRAHEYLSRFDDLYPDDTDKRKRYLAMLAVLDDEVGRIVAALERNGLMNNTLLWVTSDNGAVRGYGSTGALRGGKHSAYEGGIRVPSFVVWEGRIAPGVSGQPTTNVDLLPTLLTLAGLPLGRDVDGVDLSGHLLGGAPIARGVAVPSTEYGDAYRLGRWKVVRDYRGGEPLPAELYDLVADPGETTDLAAVHPDTLAYLLARFPYNHPPGPDTLGTPVGGPVDPPVPPPSEPSVRVLPNPSASRITALVEVAIPEEGPLHVEVFDALGRLVAVLHDGPRAAGVHRFALPPGSSGVVAIRASGPFGVRTATATRIR
jgi:arylsulfatase A